MQRVWQTVERHKVDDEGSLLNGIYCLAELATAPACMEPFLDDGAPPVGAGAMSSFLFFFWVSGCSATNELKHSSSWCVLLRRPVLHMCTPCSSVHSAKAPGTTEANNAVTRAMQCSAVAAPLLAVIEESNSPQLQEACLHALCKCLSHEPGTAAALVAKGAVSSGVTLLPSSEPDIQVCHPLAHVPAPPGRAMKCFCSRKIRAESRQFRRSARWRFKA